MLFEALPLDLATAVCRSVTTHGDLSRLAGSCRALSRVVRRMLRDPPWISTLVLSDDPLARARGLGAQDEGEEPLVDVVPVDAEAFHDLEVAGFAVDDVDVMAGGPQGGREGLDDFGAVDFSVKRRDGDEKRRGPL